VPTSHGVGFIHSTLVWINTRHWVQLSSTRGPTCGLTPLTSLTQSRSNSCSSKHFFIPRCNTSYPSGHFCDLPIAWAMDMLEDDKIDPDKTPPGLAIPSSQSSNMAAPSSASVSTATTASWYESTESFSSVASSELYWTSLSFYKSSNSAHKCLMWTELFKILTNRSWYAEKQITKEIRIITIKKKEKKLFWRKI